MNKSIFHYAPSFYTPEGAYWANESALRAEYSRLRSIAQKRISRIKGTEFENSAIFRENRHGFLTVKQASAQNVIIDELMSIRRFLLDETSLLSGARERKNRILSTLQERGYNFVTSENYWQYTQFMDWAGAMFKGAQFGSGFVNDFFERTYKAGASLNQMKRWFLNWNKRMNAGDEYANVSAASADFLLRRPRN